MKFTLHIWRQENARAKGHFETYEIDNISADCSFLEMLDQLNEKLINDHIAHPVCFDNDCREGICGMCGLYINGRPHGNDDGVTTCQLHMRHFTGGVPDANNILVPKHKADQAMDAAACIGCGACVAACKNASAMLFVGAKVSHLNLLPQGQPEALDRARKMIIKMDELGFGGCTNTYACEAECPKQIKRQNIARLNRQWIGQMFGRDRNE